MLDLGSWLGLAILHFPVISYVLPYIFFSTRSQGIPINLVFLGWCGSGAE